MFSWLKNRMELKTFLTVVKSIHLQPRYQLITNWTKDIALWNSLLKEFKVANFLVLFSISFYFWLLTFFGSATRAVSLRHLQLGHQLLQVCFEWDSFTSTWLFNLHTCDLTPSNRLFPFKSVSISLRFSFSGKIEIIIRQQLSDQMERIVLEDFNQNSGSVTLVEKNKLKLLTRRTNSRKHLPKQVVFESQNLEIK